jgi:RND superfamily putative drug exporter
MPERLARAVLRHRLAVLACWAAALLAGLVAASRLPAVLSNSFTVPGSESARAGYLLAAEFGERPESTFVVVFPVRRSSDAALRRRLQRRLDTAARAVPTGRARKLRRGGGILYGDIATRLSLSSAARHTGALRAALRDGTGPLAFVTGQPAIERDLQRVLDSDLHRGEAIAVGVSLVVLIVVFGLTPAIVIPFIFAACTVSASLAAVYVAARLFLTTSYVTNLVVLIGLGLAIDYSLLVVHRYREEIERGRSPSDAVVRTMATAGRTVVYSGTAVAVGLGLLLFVPVPFIRSMGLGAVVMPLVSIAGVLTLQPVLLPVLGLRLRRRTAGGERAWTRFARAVVRRRLVLCLGTLGILAVFAVPAVRMQMIPGSFSGLPADTESAGALELLSNGVGPGAVTPASIVVDATSADRARVHRAVKRLSDALFHDPEVLLVARGTRPPYTAGGGRYTRVVVVGRHEYGDAASQSLVRRLRSRVVPVAGFPSSVTVEAGGAPAQGVDFLDTTYRAFPWLALAVCLVTFAILARAFRSLLVPLMTVLVDALVVAAVLGLLVVCFGSVEGWIPVFLFAVLFGLSMDYQVFLVMRMREAWDRTGESDPAVVEGLARTGRIITAAGLIMLGAFLGLIAGAVPGLRELGAGLALAILLDASLVRLLLVPSLMSLLGDWAWWLPATRTEGSESPSPGSLFDDGNREPHRR